MIESTPVGRCASLTAALLMSFGASIATGAIGAPALVATPVAPSGSLAFGAALTGSGLFFTAAAAVAAQLSSSARVARSLVSARWHRLSRCALPVTPGRARCRACRRWAGPSRCIRTRVTAGGCCGLYGLLIGSVVHGIGDEVGNSSVVRQVVLGTAAFRRRDIRN